MSDTENQPAPASNGAKAIRTPKLAPAPVPQETPWKAPTVDGSQSRPNFEAAEAAKPIKKPAASVEPVKDSGSKRSTTGKEKWVPYAPVVPIPSNSSGSSSSSGSSRNRQKRQQSSNGSYRNRRSQGERSSNGGASSGNGGSNPANGGSEKRKSGNLSNPSSRGAGHQRSQSKAGKLADGASSRASTADSSSSASNTNGASEGAQPQPANGSAKPADRLNTNGNSAASPEAPVSGVESLQVSESQRGERPQKLPSHHNSKPNYAMRPNTSGKKSKDPRYGGSHKPHFHQGAYIANGMPYQMMPIPMAPQDYIYPAEYIFSALVNQINHYFSLDNLCRDLFLRKNMNDDGLVPLSVISSFNRVRSITTDANMVLQACQSAPNLVVIGDKVRAAQNWERWVVPESQRLPAGLEKSTAVESAVLTDSATAAAAAAGTGAAAAAVSKEPKFEVQHAVPFVPKSN